MTYEEALAITNKSLEELKHLPEQDNISYMLTVKQALEKQIPNEVVRIHSKYQRWYNDKFLCPCCGKSAETDCGDPFENYGLDWCNNCGQKLDWSEKK